MRPDRWRLAGLAAVAASLALAGCAEFVRPPPKPDPQAAAGASFVARACAGCHAVGLNDAPRDPASPPFRRLAARRTDAQLQAAFAQVAQHGHVQMPPIYMTDDEQAAVLAYFRRLRLRSLPHA